MTEPNGSKPLAPFKTWRSALPSEGVVAVNGHRRKGKTRDVWAMAEKLHNSGRPVVAFRFPKAQRLLLPGWVTHVDRLTALGKQPPSVVICDEMARQAHARDHATNDNKEWLRLLAIVAQFHHLLFAIYQHSRQMELGLAMDSDLMLFKQPSQLHIRFARTELKPEISEAYNLFVTHTKGDSRNMVYIVDWHTGRKGFIRGAGKPSFWSEGLSTAYALAAAGG